jgi:quercetin dioxygenase-like cupin family protein
MENKDILTAGILEKTLEIQKKYPGLSRDLNETPVLAPDYNNPNLNQQELDDYRQSMGILISHSDAISIGDSGEIPSHPRPDARRTLDAHLLKFDLGREIENLKLEGNWLAGNQSAKTLLKSDDLRIVLIAMHQGNEMKMHQSSGPISLQVLEGYIQFKTLQDEVELRSGDLIGLHKNILHQVLSKEQSIILLTMHNTPTDPDEKEMDAQKDIEKKDEEIIEKSENINFPDFPTYPPKDNVYKAPEKIEEKESTG